MAIQNIIQALKISIYQNIKLQYYLYYIFETMI